jgi:hypothetical protein
MPAQTILGYTLKQEISITISAITGKACSVVFQGTGAYTDGHQISLPATDDASLYDVRKANVVRGYGQHEGAHHTYTPLAEIIRLRNLAAGCDLTDPAVQKGLKARKPNKEWLAWVFETFNFWNACEDWRIEHHQMRDWPGTRINIDATRCEVNANDIANVKKNPQALMDPFRTASALLTWYNAVENSYTCAGLAQESIAITTAVNPVLVEIVEPFWKRVTATASLDDLEANRVIWKVAQDLCEQLIRVYLRDEPPPPPAADPSGQGSAGPTPEDQGQAGPSTDKAPDTAPEPQEGGGDTSQDQQATPGQGDAPSEPDPDPAAPNQSGDPAPGDEQGSAQGAPDDQPSSPTPGAGPPNADGLGDTDTPPPDQTGADGTSNADTDDARERALHQGRDAAKRSTMEERDQLDVSEVMEEFSAIAQDLMREGESVSTTSLADEIVVISRPNPVGEITHYRATQSEIAQVTTALSGAMRSLVIARDRRRIRYNREDGDLDMGNVLGLAMRAPDIYHQTVVYPGNNTAISFLIDISASMNHRESQAKKTRVRIATDALVALLEALGAARRVVTRFEAYTSQMDQPTVRLMKDFHDGPAVAKMEISRLLRDMAERQLKMGGTPTGEMMLKSWDVLRKRREDKRVIILVTDGEPDDPGLANRAAQAIKREGGIVVGIGVGKKPHFELDHWILVPRIEELPVKMMGAIRTIVSN